MSFCTQCGAQLVEGEVHDCPAQSAISQQVKANNQTAATLSVPVTRSWGNLDIHQIIALIKNPFSSQQLSVETGLRYGVLGFLTSVLGFFFWFAAVYHNLTSGLMSLLGGGKGNSSINDLIGLNYVKDFFVVLLIMAIGLGVIYLLFNWMGDYKKDFKLATAVLGSAQWTAAIGFILAAIISYISLTISILAFLVVWLTNVIIIYLVSSEFFAVLTSKKVAVVALTITVNTIVIGLILQYVVKTGVTSMMNDSSSIGNIIMNSILGGL